MRAVVGAGTPREVTVADWRDLAACRGEDPELFFPPGSGEAAPGRITTAKAVCRRCPVRSECLRWALDVENQHGICGGTTQHERSMLRHTRAPLRMLP